MRRRSLWLECSLHEKTNLHAIILRWHTFMQLKSSKVIQSLSQIFTNQLVAQTQGRVSRRIICELFHLHDCVSSVERLLLLDLDRSRRSSHLCIIWQLIVERKELNRLLVLQLRFNQFVFKCFPNWKDVSWNWLKALACFAEIIRICFFGNDLSQRKRSLPSKWQMLDW